MNQASVNQAGGTPLEVISVVISAEETVTWKARLPIHVIFLDFRLSLDVSLSIHCGTLQPLPSFMAWLICRPSVQAA